MKFPYTPGWEGSGTVVETGGGGFLNGFLKGKRVAFVKQAEIGTYKVGGAFAEYMVTDNRSVIPITDEVSFEQASTYFVNPLTAVCMVERCVDLKSKACIVTAAASQIGRMLIPLLLMNGITPIMTVRREEQAEMLRKMYPKLEKCVINTGLEGWETHLGMICKKLKPSTCLECIAGDTMGTMLEFMGFGATLILYGLLSDKPAGNINTIGFIGKDQTIESFLLFAYLSKKSMTEHLAILMKAESLYSSILKTQV